MVRAAPSGVGDQLFNMASGIRRLSWRSREWCQFLATLPLDPDEIRDPADEIGSRDFILCGAPRTGTTFLSAFLVQPPVVTTVMEPWDGMRVAPAALFSSLRTEIRSNGGVSAGRLDLDVLRREGRVQWATDGSTQVRGDMDAKFMLGVKWPVYWRFLPHLPDTKFLVTLRHPYEVIASFRRQGGRLRMGLDYDTAFNRKMNDELSRSTRSLAVRRVRMFDYIHERILPFIDRPNVLTVRYERWFAEPEAVRRRISDFLGVPLQQGPARLRRPAKASLSSSDRALIRTECRTAGALGYDLD